MSLGYQNQISSKMAFKADSMITAPLAKPIETVQKKIEGSVDTLVKKVDKDKDSKKVRNAIAVGSSVLVLSALVALLNPKISPKIVDELKTLSKKAETKAHKNKSDTFINKFYTGCKSLSDATVKGIRFINNFNSAKDLGFKWLCTEKKDFLDVRNKSTRNVLKKIDGGVRKVLKKPHEAITNLFDKIGKHTVLSNYSRAAKKMNTLETIISQHKSKLSEVQRRELEAKLTEIQKVRAYFSKTSINDRFACQEELMSNLESDFLARYHKYASGFTNKWQNKSDHISKHMSFWAQEILYPKQLKIQKNGFDSVSKLIGDGVSEKGLYEDAMALLGSHLSIEEKTVLKKSFDKASKSLRKANHSECVSYFDKKSDLILGSAPTDILTAIVGLGLSGIALTKADNNSERGSKLLTGVFPVIGGLGASMLFTARLISGPIGMVAGAGVGVGLNIIGSFANKHILGKKEVDISG